MEESKRTHVINRESGGASPSLIVRASNVSGNAETRSRSRDTNVPEMGWLTCPTRRPPQGRTDGERDPGDGSRAARQGAAPQPRAAERARPHLGLRPADILDSRPSDLWENTSFGRKPLHLLQRQREMNPWSQRSRVLVSFRPHVAPGRPALSVSQQSLRRVK